MNLPVDSCDVLAVQRALRDRLLDVKSACRDAPARELAARMLLYVDDPAAAWRTCAQWLLERTGAQRIDGAFGVRTDRCYRAAFELRRTDADMPSIAGAAMDGHDPAIQFVWASDTAVVFEDVATDRRLGSGVRTALLAACTRSKIAVALRDRGRDVGLLCADSGVARVRAEDWERIDRAARDVIGPVLAAALGLGATGPHGARDAPADVALTPAELRVARLVVAGCSYKEIARRLGRAVSTVDHQLRSLRRKLGVNSSAKLMRELVARLPCDRP